MKFLAVLFVSIVTTSAFAQKNENIGVIRQALGEQCSVVANYQEPEAGECGGGEVPVGDAQVSGLMTVERGKTYVARFTLINSRDEVEEVVETEPYYATRDDNWTIDNYYLALPSLGKYAIKMEIINANTGTSICTDQQLINTAH